MYNTLIEELKDYIVSSHNITTAAIPIIKLKLDCTFLDHPLSLEVDLTISDTDDEAKLQKLQDSINFVQHHLYSNHLLLPVILFLKKLTLSHNLNDLYTGGVSSYSLMIMLVCVMTMIYGLPEDATPPKGSLL